VDVENRDALFLNQTPQGFEYNTILNAHKNSQKDATDDISLLELDQIKCKIIEGSSNNIKITTSADIHTAGSILNLIK
jgi:2-C-methyl-D-erythritol 4-phosphate cytidylyltransferase